MSKAQGLEEAHSGQIRGLAEAGADQRSWKVHIWKGNFPELILIYVPELTGV